MRRSWGRRRTIPPGTTTITVHGGPRRLLLLVVAMVVVMLSMMSTSQCTTTAFSHQYLYGPRRNPGININHHHHINHYSHHHHHLGKNNHSARHAPTIWKMTTAFTGSSSSTARLCSQQGKQRQEDDHQEQQKQQQQQQSKAEGDDMTKDQDNLDKNNNNDNDSVVVDQDDDGDDQSTSTRSPVTTNTTTTSATATSTTPFSSPPNRIPTSKGRQRSSSSHRRRFRQALPFQDDTLDRTILQTAIPSILNLAVVPIVNSVDTFWVGRLGVALALAGQSAANQVSFTIFFLIAFVPSITAPLVASAVASGNTQAAQDRVSESLWLCWVLGSMGTLVLVLFPRTILTWLLLPADAPALDYAAPYLRWRALGMVPSLMAATGSAAYRGLLDTVTPLKVSLTTNLVNLVLDPLLMFGLRGFAGGRGAIGGGGAGIVRGMGYVGAAVATAASESLGGILYLRLLLKRKLTRWRLLLRPPSIKALLPLLQGGAAMLLRQVALNAGFLVATRRAQQMDPTGVAGAAYGITMQIYSIGIICLVGMQNAAAALVPSFRAGGASAVAKTNDDGEHNGQDGISQARACADRLLSWSTLAGIGLGVLQFTLLPFLVPLFSTLPRVQEAVFIPSLIASLIHVVNGPILAGEGIMIGTGSYRALALITSTWIATMMALLTWTPLGKRLDGIMWSILLSSIVQAVGVVGHYLTMGPLAAKKDTEINGAH